MLLVDQFLTRRSFARQLLQCKNKALVMMWKDICIFHEVNTGSYSISLSGESIEYEVRLQGLLRIFGFSVFLFSRSLR